MVKLNQDGALSGLLVSLILTLVLLIVVLIFAGWAYSSREDYKNNTDAKIQTAVAAAQQQESTVKDAQFAGVKEPT
jgi:uncharacterized protein (UPF0333 family)